MRHGVAFHGHFLPSLASLAAFLAAAILAISSSRLRRTCAKARARQGNSHFVGPGKFYADWNGYKAATRCRCHYSVVKGRRFAIAGIRTREPVGAGSN